MYSIAKERKGSEVDLSAVSAHIVCACSSCRCHSLSPRVSQQTKCKNINTNAVTMCQEFDPHPPKKRRKMQLGQMSTRGVVLNRLQQSVVAL